ncbi:MAG: hypothetical protein KDJ90_09500 [Nitratireductor sp.]|nr:hypothetical protein [Nitratireductor sp.]
MKSSTCFAVSALAIVAMLAGKARAISDDTEWTDELVCSAGLANYFFLNAAPKRIGEIEGWYAFRSASGATYDCQLQGDVVAFRWKNDSGPMASRSTQFKKSGNTLTIIGDLGTARFRLTDGKWSFVE